MAKFRELCDKINRSDDPTKCRAEMSYLIKKFDPGQLFQFEQAVEHGKTLITEWLPKYKFKDWKKSQTLNKEITEDDKRIRAGEIADILGDASRWHSHGRGISMKTLSGSDLRLKVEDFGQNPELNSLICNYYQLAIDFYGKLGHKSYIHLQLGNKRIS